MSDWAVFWSGVGGVLAGTVVGAVTSFLIARSTLLRTRADDKELAREERNEDAARRSTEALIDLQEALKWDRTEQVGPLDWLATVSQAVESLVRVTKLDIPILGSLSMGRRIYSARKNAQATRDWMLPIVEHYERGLITEDELAQELLEVLSARHLYGIVVTLISDIDVYRNSGEEPTNEQPIVTPPIPKYMKELDVFSLGEPNYACAAEGRADRLLRRSSHVSRSTATWFIRPGGGCGRVWVPRWRRLPTPGPDRPGGNGAPARSAGR